MSQMLELFGDLEPFITSSDDFSANTKPKLSEYFVIPKNAEC